MSIVSQAVADRTLALDVYEDADVDVLDPAGDSWETWDDSQDLPWALGPATDEDAPTLADRSWWASQNREHHTLDAIAPECDGIDPWVYQLEQLAADMDAGQYPTWID